MILDPRSVSAAFYVYHRRCAERGTAASHHIMARESDRRRARARSDITYTPSFCEQVQRWTLWDLAAVSRPFCRSGRTCAHLHSRRALASVPLRASAQHPGFPGSSRCERADLVRNANVAPAVVDSSSRSVSHLCVAEMRSGLAGLGLEPDSPPTELAQLVSRESRLGSADQLTRKRRHGRNEQPIWPAGRRWSRLRGRRAGRHHVRRGGGGAASRASATPPSGAHCPATLCSVQPCRSRLHRLRQPRRLQLCVSQPTGRCVGTSNVLDMPMRWKRSLVGFVSLAALVSGIAPPSLRRACGAKFLSALFSMSARHVAHRKFLGINPDRLPAARHGSALWSARCQCCAGVWRIRVARVA